MAYVEKYSMVIATHLTSIKERIVKNVLYRRTLRPFKFRKLLNSTRIVKNQFNSKQIIPILQPKIINFFRRIHIWLIFHNIFICYNPKVTFENTFLFRGILIMKTPFSYYFPGMFENLALRLGMFQLFLAVPLTVSSNR